MHGESGLAGPVPVEPSRSALDVPAIELIEQLLLDADEPVTLVATGALTNMADVVERLPHLRSRIARARDHGRSSRPRATGLRRPSSTSGSTRTPRTSSSVLRVRRGRATPEDGIALTMIGLEVTHRAWLTDEHADALRPTGRAGRFVAELLDHFVGFHQERFGWEGGPIHDAVTIAHLIDPTLVTTLPMNVQIETESPLCVGRTVADRWSVTGLPGQRPRGPGHRS